MRGPHLLFTGLLTAVIAAGGVRAAAGSPLLAIVPERDAATLATHALTWSTSAGARYHLLTSTDLSRWTAGFEGWPVAGDGGDNQYPLYALAPLAFYRIHDETVSGEQLLNLPMPADDTRYDSYAEFEGPQWPNSYGAGHIALWHGDKLAAYSITIDDNNKPDFPFWLQVSADYGWKLTWFVIVHPYVWDIYTKVPGSNTGYYGTLADFRDLRARGHDIQLHGACGAMNDLSAAAYEDHVARSVQVLGDAVGAPIRTFAYPCGKITSNDGTVDYRAVIERLMIGARGTVGGVTPVHLLDYLNTQSLGVNALVAGAPGTAFGRVYDNTRVLRYSQYRGWCVTLYHGLDGAGEAQARTTFDYVKAHEDSFWVAPFTDVAKYAQERESGVLHVFAARTNAIEFAVSDRLDDAVFDHPLTVKFRLDARWSGIEAEQNGRPTTARTVLHGGVPYALVDAVPDRGIVIVRRTAH